MPIPNCTKAIVIGVLLASGPAAALAQTGPDVIVGDVGGTYSGDILEYAPIGGIAAYAFKTESCNIGDQVLLWLSGTNEHPVIAQNMFRLKDGRFEQIGQAWLKHGFCALSLTLCGSCQSTDCSTLGIGCSDPYSAGLNAQQSNLGPKSEVNAVTGGFAYPFCSGGWCPPAGSSNINRRLQVNSIDLEPGNPNVLYFIESQYVTPDDAAWGNAANNASWRKVLVNQITSVTVDGATNRQSLAIQAWSVYDSNVEVSKMIVQDEGGPGMHGRLWLAVAATDLGGGTWHYEYAIQNLNSDRSGRAFTVPIQTGATVTNTGFHDVDYHSGEPYDGTDWTVTVSSGSITWATDTYAQNPNANALRWGTLYSFWFDADVAPDPSGTVELELFKPGTPTTLTTFMTTPMFNAACTCPGDVNGSSDTNGEDIGDFVEMMLGTLPVDTCADLAAPYGVPLDMADLAEFVIVLLTPPACN